MADFDFEDDPALGVSEASNGVADGPASSSYLPAGDEDIQDYAGTSHLGTSHSQTSHLGTSHSQTSHLGTSHLGTSHLGTSHSQGGMSGYADLDALPAATDNEEENEQALQSSSALDAFLAQWEAKLSEKRQVEADRRAEVVAKAQQELSKFHEERELLREKKQSINRKDEQVKVEKLVADLELENPWERVVNLVDMQAEASKLDLTRMKQLFIQLKNDPTSANSNNKTKA